MLVRPKIRQGRKVPKTQNSEILSLFKLFSIVASRSTHEEYRKIAMHLKKPRTQRAVVTLKQLVKDTAECPGKVAVVVTKIVGDDSVVVIPHPINVACLEISQSAKAKIEKYGGQVFKLDELFRVAPTPDAMVILQGDPSTRKSCHYFGVPGDRHNPAKPRVISTGSERKLKQIQK